ncbi:MAG: lipid-A-disaccharide synthase [Bacteroidales bacterium]|nr:lipid-A-disaccharide synthase [Bacteroidales bacterium]
MRYFIIAGEKSGDLHGSNLIRELHRTDPDAAVFCWGGDLMQKAGAKLLKHYGKTSFMGFMAVLKNLPAITRNFSECKKQLLETRPDVVILIDYPGFNLRIARFAKKAGFKVFYYISPKLWAWREGRVKKIKKYIDRMYIIFPFEVEFYRKHGIEAHYFGNPLVDEIEKQTSMISESIGKKSIQDTDSRPVIALLAGSRRHEVELVLPRMLEVVNQFPEYQFVIAGVSTLPEDLYKNITGEIPVKLVIDRTYEVLANSTAALVTSGTATLETALMNVPQVVCYKGDFISMLIAWLVIRVDYISLVNLIMGKEVVKELVQYSLNKKNLAKELLSILPGSPGREKMLSDYAMLREKLGKPGASYKVAEDIVKNLI